LESIDEFLIKFLWFAFEDSVTNCLLHTFHYVRYEIELDLVHLIVFTWMCSFLACLFWYE